MIRINLLPTEEAERAEGKRQELAGYALVIAVAVLLVLGAHGWQQLQVRFTKTKLANVNKRIVDIQGSYTEVARMEAQKQELREKLDVIAQLETKSAGPVRVLADISDATPDRLWLTEYTDVGGKMKITGFGVDEQTIADFLRRLGGSAYFKSVDLDETSQDTKSGVRDKKFVISGQVNYLGAQAAPAAAKTAKAPEGTVTPAKAEAGAKP